MQGDEGRKSVSNDGLNRTDATTDWTVVHHVDPYVGDGCTKDDVRESIDVDQATLITS